VSSGSAARVGRGTAVNWIAWILARALALATLLMLARSLGVDELGALLAALAAGVLGAALATGGLADATARQAAAAGHGPQPAAEQTDFGRGDLLRGMRRFAAVLPLVLAAVIVITARSSSHFGASELVASSLLAVTQGAITISASVFRARNQPARFALATNLASSAGRAVIALLALVVALSGEAVLWGFALLNLTVAIVTWLQAIDGLPSGSTSMRGVGALQIGGVVWSLLGNLDVVTVGLLLGAGRAGTYSVALRVAEFSAQFVIAISLFFLPEATRLAVQGQREQLVALYRSACRWSAVTTLLAAGIGFVTAPQIAEIVLPDKAGTITTLLRILFGGYAVQGALGVSYATLSAAGAFRAIWTSSIVGLPLMVVATVVLTQVWGLPGAAASTLVGYVGLNVWWTERTIAELGASPIDGRYLRGVAACAIGWAAAGLVAALAGDASAVAAFGGAVVAGLAAAAAALVLLRAFTPGELAALRRLLGGLGRSGRPDPASSPVARR
jgi:O-antigen/teichoic acid export membrane protein